MASPDLKVQDGGRDLGEGAEEERETNGHVVGRRRLVVYLMSKRQVALTQTRSSQVRNPNFCPLNLYLTSCIGGQPKGRSSASAYW